LQFFQWINLKFWILRNALNPWAINLVRNNCKEQFDINNTPDSPPGGQLNWQVLWKWSSMRFRVQFPPTYLVCHVRGIVGTPGGYSGSGWITRPHVMRACAQLVADSSRHKKKKNCLLISLKFNNSLPCRTKQSL